MTRQITVHQKDPAPGKMFGVVRDKSGTPRVDGDPQKLHPAIIAMFSKAERESLGLWGGDTIIGASGVGRIELDGDTYTAIDGVVAANELWLDGVCYAPSGRFDVPAGGTFTVKKES